MVVLSKSLLASKWNLIDEEWAATLVVLRMKVRGSFWNGCTAEEKKKTVFFAFNAHQYSVPSLFLIQSQREEKFIELVIQHITTRWIVC